MARPNRRTDQMSQALAGAAEAAVEQAQAYQSESATALPVPQTPSSAPAAAPADDLGHQETTRRLDLFDRPKREPAGDLVQISFRCPRELKRSIDRLCFEHELTLQEVGQEALRLILDRAGQDR